MQPHTMTLSHFSIDIIAYYSTTKHTKKTLFPVGGNLSYPNVIKFVYTVPVRTFYFAACLEFRQ